MTSHMLDFNQLFDPDFLNALRYFNLRLKKVARGGRHAEQKSWDRGAGLEFADFKPYVAGDDLRAIDWNIYQRLGRLFVKVYEEHQDMPVYQMVDVSQSMFYDRNPRINAGLRTALALASISLDQHDAVGLYPFSDEMQVKVKSISGMRNLMRYARHLVDLDARKGTDLSVALHKFASLKMRRGLLVVISDFFDPEGVEKVLEALKMTRHRLLLVQLVKPEDADPSLNEDFYGDVQLRDSETGEAVDVAINPATLSRYKKIYAEFNKQLTEFSQQYNAGFIQLNADEDVLEQLSGLFTSGELTL